MLERSIAYESHLGPTLKAKGRASIAKKYKLMSHFGLQAKERTKDEGLQFYIEHN